MLKKANKSSKANPVKKPTGEYVIVASRYNDVYVDAMMNSAEAELKRAGVEKIRIVRVPGAYEIPIVAAKIARTNPKAVSAIICLGVILRGQTVHADHIGRAVSNALMDIQLNYEVPIIHEVLLLENEKQAKVRCLGGKFNRGTEAAQTALAMGEVMDILSFDDIPW
jgi:6,7-dimethyl-8-ribityllumazine synthase